MPFVTPGIYQLTLEAASLIADFDGLEGRPGRVPMKDSSTEAFISFWSKERKRGKTWYILSNSMLLAFATCLGAVVGRWILRGDPPFLDPVIFFAGYGGGFLGTWFRWTDYEERYEELIHRRRG